MRIDSSCVKLLPRYRTIFCPVFEWLGHMTWPAIWISDIFDYKTYVFGPIFRCRFEYWTICQLVTFWLFGDRTCPAQWGSENQPFKIRKHSKSGLNYLDFKWSISTISCTQKKLCLYLKWSRLEKVWFQMVGTIVPPIWKPTIQKPDFWLA